MATQKLTQSPQTSNPPPLTPALAAKLARRSGIEADYITRWYTELAAGVHGDGPRLVAIWLQVISQEATR